MFSHTCECACLVHSDVLSFCPVVNWLKTMGTTNLLSSNKTIKLSVFLDGLLYDINLVLCLTPGIFSDRLQLAVKCTSAHQMSTAGIEPDPVICGFWLKYNVVFIILGKSIIIPVEKVMSRIYILWKIGINSIAFIPYGICIIKNSFGCGVHSNSLFHYQYATCVFKSENESLI